jgi:dienelactone hydrolase
MNIISNTVSYADDQVELEGLFAFDESISGPRPVVLIHHSWVGRDDFVAGKARKLAALGYLAFAADCYGKGVLGSNPEQCAALMQPFMENRALLQKRLHAALTAVKMLPWADHRRIAAIGFCFGGLCALDLARSGANLRGAVAFHGLLTPEDNIPEPDIKAKILVLHGHDDPMAPPAHVLALQNELTRANVDWQTHIYGQTMHAFTNPLANNPDFGTVYQSRSDERAWLAMRNFLVEVFI